MDKMPNRPQGAGAPDPKTLKKVGMQVSIFMGITMSFFLSLIGNLMSPQFQIMGFIVSFIASTIISLVIGFIVPMKKIGDSAVKAARLRPGSIPARCLESLISDLIYTPFITLAMVFLAYSKAVHENPEMQFLPMFLTSLLVSMIAGYVLIFFFMPLYVRIAMKNNGIEPPIGGPPEK